MSERPPLFVDQTDSRATHLTGTFSARRTPHGEDLPAGDVPERASRVVDPVGQAATRAQAWEEGVATALNHAILDADGVRLRLEHLDGRAWVNPYAGCDEITVARPHVPYGPAHLPAGEADAGYLREAARTLEEHVRPFGSNLRATVVQLLRDAADAVHHATSTASDAARGRQA